MQKQAKNNIFNRKAVGEITRGGFSNLVKEVEAGSVTVLYKFNEPVAIILPCDRTLEAAFQASAGAGAFIADAENNDTPQGLMLAFFRSLIESAAIAKVILGIDSANAVEQEVLEVVTEWLKTKNSSQDKALSSHDNLSGDVSEVKQEGLADTSSSLSRKRGQAKKETSSPQKRKIGTKREPSRL